MRFRRRLLAACIGASIFGSLLNAQQPPASSASSAVVPRLVNFSGRAADTEGKIITGITGATFAIYKDQYEGSPLWLETQNVQGDAKGSYTAQLGATKPEGLPLDLFTSGEARWLGVSINGGREQPRILLLSVPYALKAADAETVGGLPPSAFVLANKSQTTGTSSQPSATVASTKNNAVAAANPAVTGKGVVNFIPMWDSTSDIVDSLIFQKSSQIGVNTTTPAATLDVNGAGDIRNTLTLFPNGTNNTLAVSGTAFKVGSTGKVSFVKGQTFPGTAKLGTANTFGATQTFSGNSQKMILGDPGCGPGYAGIGFGALSSCQNYSLIGDGVNTLINRPTGGGIAFRESNVDEMVIAPGGAVGIGTFFPPQAKLDVFSGTAGIHAPMAQFGSPGTGDCNSILTYTGSGIAEVFQAGTPGCFIPGAVAGDSGLRVSPGNRILLGDINANRVLIDNVGNVEQQRSAGGMVKAMLHFSPNNGGRIISCFNSTRSGAAATTPPCGFIFDITGSGDYIFDFGFEVDDRIYSAVPDQTGVTVSTCGNQDGECIHTGSLTNNQVEVTVYAPIPNTFLDSKIHLIVY